MVVVRVDLWVRSVDGIVRIFVLGGRDLNVFDVRMIVSMVTVAGRQNVVRSKGERGIRAFIFFDRRLGLWCLALVQNEGVKNRFITHL